MRAQERGEKREERREEGGEKMKEKRGERGEKRERERGEERGLRREERRERRGGRGQEREERGEERREEQEEKRVDEPGLKFPDWCDAWGVIIFAMYVSRVSIRVRGSYQVFCCGGSGSIVHSLTRSSAKAVGAGYVFSFVFIDFAVSPPQALLGRTRRQKMHGFYILPCISDERSIKSTFGIQDV